MTDDDWLCTYLLRFGTETIASAVLQEGETAFLMVMGEALKAAGRTQSAWWIITNAYRQRRDQSAELKLADLI